MRLPTSDTCSFCGGQMVSISGRAPTQAAMPPIPTADAAMAVAAGMGGNNNNNNPPSIEQVQERAAQILTAILPADLFAEAAAASSAGVGTDKDVLEELPLVKIEPYVALRVTKKQSAREQLAAAARLAASHAAQHLSAHPAASILMIDSDGGLAPSATLGLHAPFHAERIVSLPMQLLPMSEMTVAAAA